MLNEKVSPIGIEIPISFAHDIGSFPDAKICEIYVTVAIAVPWAAEAMMNSVETMKSSVVGHVTKS